MKHRIVLLMLSLLLLTACAGRFHTDAPMERFPFSHTGMRSDGCYSLTAERTADGWQAHYSLFTTQEFTLPMTQADADALAALLDTCDLWAWNRFHKVDPIVSDSRSFRLDIRFADGKELSASGGNRFPDGYGAAENAVKSFFIQLMETNGMENPT